MSEEIKKRDEGEIAAIRAWYESTKGFYQIEKEINLPSVTLFKLVNAIPDYRGTRFSIGKWLRHIWATATTPDRLKKKEFPVHHYDKGLQYCAKAYAAILNHHQMPISKTEGYDSRNNGIAERVNGILKEEFLKYKDVHAGNIEVTLSRIIEIYHTRRPHLSLGMLTPEQVHNGEMPGRKFWKKLS